MQWGNSNEELHKHKHVHPSLDVVGGTCRVFDDLEDLVKERSDAFPAVSNDDFEFEALLGGFRPVYGNLAL